MDRSEYFQQLSAYETSLERFMNERYPDSTLVCEWTLEHGFEEFFIVSLRCHGSDAKIHIVEFEPCRTRIKDVVMDTVTWDEFMKKLSNFNFLYRDCSTVCNNQLAMLNDDGRCVLQQCFKTLCRTFALSDFCVSLHEIQVKNLKKLRHEISECIQETLLCLILPKVILERKPSECLQSKHYDESVAASKLISIIMANLPISTYFQCEGCIINHASQREHECLTHSDSEKYHLLEDSIISALNVYAVGLAVCENCCTCNFNDDFFSKWSLEDYRCAFRNHFQAYEHNIKGY